jgi:WhiB family redox-sensing transcriptional regulator
MGRPPNGEPPAACGTPPVAALPDRACAAVPDPLVFFPENNTQLAEALRICRRCPHRQPCKDWAVATGQPDGVWGGTTANERRNLIRRRNA